MSDENDKGEEEVDAAIEAQSEAIVEAQPEEALEPVRDETPLALAEEEF